MEEVTSLLFIEALVSSPFILLATAYANVEHSNFSIWYRQHGHKGDPEAEAGMIEAEKKRVVTISGGVVLGLVVGAIVNYFV